MMTTRRIIQTCRRGFTLTEVLISIALVVLLVLAINRIMAMTAQVVGSGHALGTITRDARAVQTVIADDGKKIASDVPFMTIRSSRVAAFRNRQDQLSDYDYSPTGTYASRGEEYYAVDRMMRTRDRDQNNSDADAADLTPVAIYNDRNHRNDILSFFVEGNFLRQTGDDGEFVADMSCTEAWIKYGHVRQPDGSGALNGHREQSWLPYFLNWETAPLFDFIANPTITASETAATNPDNFYASNWILGRFAMLLREPTSSTTVPPSEQNRIYDDAGAWQWYVARSLTPDPDSLAPLSVNSRATEGGPGYTLPNTLPHIQYARYDLAGTSITTYTQILNAVIAYVASTAATDDDDWWSRFSFRYQANRHPTKPHSSLGVARTAPILLHGCTQFTVEYAGDYVMQNADPTDATADANGIYGDVLGVYWDGATSTEIETGDFIHRGLWSDVASYRAGDFVREGGVFYQALVDNPDPTAIPPPPPPSANPAEWATGTPPRIRQIDFIAVHRGVWDSSITYSAGEYVADDGDFYRAKQANTNRDPSDDWAGPQLYWEPGTPPRSVRWYGLPRDVNADGAIAGWQSSPPLPAPVQNNDMPDVVPLRDLWQIIDPGGAAPFERLIDVDVTPPLEVIPLRNDYASTNETWDVTNTDPTLGMHFLNYYSCAWGPDATQDRRPQLVRMVTAIDHPNGRLAGPQTYEYVFKLP